MIIKTKEQRTILIEAGRRLGVVLQTLADTVAPNMPVSKLDELAESLIREGGDVPCFLGYTSEGSQRPYPATLCVSVNDEVVHGIPNESSYHLKKGDIVSLDLGLTHNGIIVDSALTVPVDGTDKKSYALMNATATALEVAMEAAQPGARVGDISHATEMSVAKTKFSVVRILGGHGVGEHVHEEPYIANVGHAGTGEELVPGMVLALEPIVNEGKASVIITNDGYTYRTKDGSRSAHFEHTILIEDGGPLVVTRRPGENK